MARGALVAALALAIAAAPTVASADLWAEAKGAASGKTAPGVDAAALHKTAVEALVAQRRRNPIAKLRLAEAARLLKQHGGSNSGDARLRYDLAAVLAAQKQCDAAIPAFHHALWFAPDHPQAARGWFELGLCHAYRGEVEDEELAWTNALGLEDEPTSRHVILANLAEARMRLGRLEDAKTAIEDAIDLEPQSPIPQFTHAVIVDRLDDRAGAIAAVKVALSLDPIGDSLDSDGVFFVPPYDVHWYRALVALGQAENSVGTAVASLRGAALGEYKKWMSASTPDDPFREIAARRIKQLELLLTKS